VSLADVLGYDIEDDFDFFPQECVSCSVSDVEVEFNSFMGDEMDMEYYESWMDQRWYEYIDSLEEQNAYWQSQQDQAEYENQQAQYYNDQGYEDGEQQAYYYRNGQLYQQGGGNYYGNYNEDGAMSGMYGQYSSLGNDLAASGADFYSNRAQSWMNPWMNAQVYQEAKDEYYQDYDQDWDEYMEYLQSQNQNQGDDYNANNAQYWSQQYAAYKNQNQDDGNYDEEAYEAMQWKYQQYQMYRQYQSGNQQSNNQKQFYSQSFSDTGISDVCGALYTYAAKCNSHFYNYQSSVDSYGSSQQVANEEQACNFIDNMQSRKYNEYGEIVLDESGVTMDMSKVNLFSPSSLTAEATRAGVTGGQIAWLFLLGIACAGMLGYGVVLHKSLMDNNIPWRPRRGELSEPTDLNRQNSGIVMGRSRSGMGMSGKNAPLI